MKQFVFDMDGTFVDLYGVADWEYQLHNSIVTPYEIAAPLIDVDELRDILNQARELGTKIVIVSWTAMDGSKEYNNAVRKAKKEWCEKYNLPIDEFHAVKYGTKKWYPLNDRNDAILFDDNADIRSQFESEEFNRAAYGVTNMLDILKKIIQEMRIENTKQNYREGTTRWDIADEQGLFSPMFKKHWKNECGLYMLGQSTRNPITGELRYWVKVGLTKRAKSRFSSYLTDCADVYFIDWYPLPENVLEKNESFCHAQLTQFANVRRTEWFKVSPQFYFDICERGFSKLNMLD